MSRTCNHWTLRKKRLESGEVKNPDAWIHWAYIREVADKGRTVGVGDQTEASGSSVWVIRFCDCIEFLFLSHLGGSMFSVASFNVFRCFTFVGFLTLNFSLSILQLRANVISQTEAYLSRHSSFFFTWLISRQFKAMILLGCLWNLSECLWNSWCIVDLQLSMVSSFQSQICHSCHQLCWPGIHLSIRARAKVGPARAIWIFQSLDSVHQSVTVCLKLCLEIVLPCVCTYLYYLSLWNLPQTWDHLTLEKTLVFLSLQGSATPKL